MTSVRCSRCNRPLKSGRRIGRACAAKERAERRREALENALRIATAPFSDRQIEDANVMIAAGKLKPLASRPNMWQATSRDSKRVYILSPLDCPCASYGPCYHRAGAAMRETYEAFQEVA